MQNLECPFCTNFDESCQQKVCDSQEYKCVKTEYTLVGNGTARRLWLRFCGQPAYCYIYHKWSCLILNEAYVQKNLSYTVNAKNCVVTCDMELRNKSSVYVTVLAVTMTIMVIELL